jgi:hypothetical protein
MILWDVYSSHRDEELLKSLKQKYPYLLIMFVPASCTGELQPLDVGVNGPWKRLVTKFAGAWLADHVKQQLDLNPDPSKVVLSTKKSVLVQPFCSWIFEATTVLKQKPLLIKSAWERTGVLVAWEFGSSERTQLLSQAMELHAKGELWKPRTDKTFQDGSVPRTRLACHGALSDIGDAAAQSAGGFGEHKTEEEEENSVVVVFEQEAASDDEAAEDLEVEKGEDVDLKTSAAAS